MKDLLVDVREMLAPLILQSEGSAGGPELGMLVWLINELPYRKRKKRKQQRPPKVKQINWSMNDLSDAMEGIAAANRFAL